MDSVPDSKRCSKCGEVKGRVEFNARKRSVDGLNAWCRLCNRGYHRAHHENNKPRLNAARNQRYRENREYEIERQRLYHLEHAEIRSAQAAARYRRTRDHHLVTGRAYYVRNSEYVLAQHRAWRAANPERSREIAHLSRARARGATIIWPVSYQTVRQRDRDICWLCQKPVDDNTRSYDHAVSLAKNGEHSTRNVRIAHKLCNARKNAQDITHQKLLL